MKHWLQAAFLSSALATSAYVVAAPIQTAQGTGVVKAIDAKTSTITLQHEPIPALKWSAMTMPFPLATPELAKGLAAGQKVKFDLEVEGSKYRITAISAIK